MVASIPQLPCLLGRMCALEHEQHSGTLALEGLRHFTGERDSASGKQALRGDVLLSRSRHCLLISL